MTKASEKLRNLSSIALDMFETSVAAVDAERSVERVIQISQHRLQIGEHAFDLDKIQSIYTVALGKAANGMARAVSVSLGPQLTEGVISSPVLDRTLSASWHRYCGGHPIPNGDSLQAARKAFELLKKANNAGTLVIFLVSGGGSAMLEFPYDESVTLEDLQSANKALVGCGARIAEINELRRRFSSVKGGGLAQAASRANQISLIVSDTNEGEAFNVASGPTIARKHGFSDLEVMRIIERCGLAERLPKSIMELLSKPRGKAAVSSSACANMLLLENQDAVRAVETRLRLLGFAVETADDLVEADVDEGCRKLLGNLVRLREQTEPSTPVAVVSGGEFVCPVSGNGIGGRNLESSLRTAILLDELYRTRPRSDVKFAALFAGTDGIDGNSPAAGAVCDETTIRRGRGLNLDADDYLKNSDAYNYFNKLGDAIEIGPTGTNVRDVRILLAS